jgi:hypothetical protein
MKRYTVKTTGQRVSFIGKEHPKVTQLPENYFQADEVEDLMQWLEMAKGFIGKIYVIDGDYNLIWDDEWQMTVPAQLNLNWMVTMEGSRKYINEDGMEIFDTFRLVITKLLP